MTRRLLVAVGWAVVGGCGGLELLCAFGISRPVFLDWLWAYVPVAFLPAWGVLLAALVLGRRVLCVAAAAVVAGHLALVLPVATGAPEPAPPGAVSLRVVSANVAYFNPTVGALLTELRGYDADVLVLQEVTPRIVTELASILGEVYPHEEVVPLPEGFGAAVFSRFPVDDAVILDVGGLPMQAVTVDVEGHDVRLWNVHTRAPTELHRRFLRDEQLDEMVELRRFEHQPLIAAGDYNATLWHEELQHLVETDLRDAADVVGQGLRGTWTGAPFGVDTAIDHVLASPDFGIESVSTGRGTGSDHRPLIVDLWLRPS